MHEMITIRRHIQEQEHEYTEATGQLSELLYAIALAGKIISREVNQAGLISLLGKTGFENIHGEEVTKLDEYAHNVLVRTLGLSGHVCLMGSEESPETVYPDNGAEHAKYVVNFDPLDGSSNIDANVSVGTIFSIHERVTPAGTRPDHSDVLQRGRDMVAAGYIVYGSSTIMVYTTRGGTVDGFTLDPSVGEFLRCHDNIRTPTESRIFSCNMGHHLYWRETIREYVETISSDRAPRGKPYSLRYIGSLVSDFHRNLLYGGIFLYPRNITGPKHEGKLRLLYEANPLAMVAVNAGGLASTGTLPVLDVQPTSLHQRTPLFIGSHEDVTEIEALLKKSCPG